MNGTQRSYANAEVASLVLEVPDGHQHLRATLRLVSGDELVFQEATVANLVRAYIQVKTHPQQSACRMNGVELAAGERKPGFAAWQLLEEG